VLLSNKFVFQPFWDYQNQKKTEWQDDFKSAIAFAHKALGHKNTSVVLSVIFSYLYTLRNQTLHGSKQKINNVISFKDYQQKNDS
jgi:hypothetical protein